jgi:hypothetical protein
VRVDVVEVAENTPRSLGPRDSPDTHTVPVAGSPPPPAHNILPLLVDIDPNAPQPGPRLGSTALPLDIDLNGPPSSPPGLGSPPPPAHHNRPFKLVIDPNAPQPGPRLGSTALPLEIDLNGPPSSPPGLGSPPPPAHHNRPFKLVIDVNASPQQSQEPTDSFDSGSHSKGSSTDHYDLASLGSSTDHYDLTSLGSPTHSSPHATGSEMSPMTSSAWEEMSTYFTKSPSRWPSQDLNPARLHGKLDIDLNRPPLSPGQTDDKPPLAQPSDPGSSKRPYPGPSLDPGPSKRPNRLLDPGPSTTSGSSSPGPLQHESEDIFSNLLSKVFKVLRG